MTAEMPLFGRPAEPASVSSPIPIPATINPTAGRGLPSKPRARRVSRPLPTSTQPAAPLPEGAVPKVAEAIMELAAALEVQEVRIKAVLLEAAEAGDLDLVRKILNLWVKGPVSEVTAQLGEIRSVQIGDTGPVSGGGA